MLLAFLVSPWFLLLAAFVGLNQWLFVAVGACPASILLERIAGVVVSTGNNDGAVMEPRGCNRWQSAANRPIAETAW